MRQQRGTVENCQGGVGGSATAVGVAMDEQQPAAKRRGRVRAEKQSREGGRSVVHIVPESYVVEKGSRVEVRWIQCRGSGQQKKMGYNQNRLVVNSCETAVDAWLVFPGALRTNTVTDDRNLRANAEFGIGNLVEIHQNC
ncbi:unnamed protein product [Strongylus vulgaris]|uniref:Uncharacterized protein n=1 Tax=Strongylus vulgaris TaxID=40348 RepID=A0A3P7KG53_STRVU|nr:unnamed protein product [Strongylus vulgaris]